MAVLLIAPRPDRAAAAQRRLVGVQRLALALYRLARVGRLLSARAPSLLRDACRHEAPRRLGSVRGLAYNIYETAPATEKLHAGTPEEAAEEIFFANSAADGGKELMLASENPALVAWSHWDQERRRHGSCSV